MNRTSFLAAVIALALPVMQAGDLYNLSLSNNGLAAKNASPKPGAAAEQPQAQEGEAAPAPAAEGEAATPAEDGAAAPAEEALPADSAGNKALQDCKRLRARLAEAEAMLTALDSPDRGLPSRGLVTRFNNAKRQVESTLDRMENTAREAAALHQQLQNKRGADYQFTIVQPDQRNKFLQDGTAAYKAMMVDVREKKSARKLRALEKFEVLRSRYQGIPEYKDADAWYERTLKDLETKWSKWQATEEKRRERLQQAKRQKMEEEDDKDFAKVERELKADGDDIAKVWYNPNPRNLRMVNNCLNKVRDAIRRRERDKERDKDREKETIGCVPDLLNAFWANMDKAREMMIAGDLEGARDLIEGDETFTVLNRLNREVFPDEYKAPIREQRQHMLREIKNRDSEISKTTRSLEQKLASFERDLGNVEARLDSIIEDIEREQVSDVGNSTVNVRDNPPASPDPAAAEEPSADKPAEQADDKPAGDAQPAGDKPAADKPAGDAKPANKGGKSKNTKNKDKGSKNNKGAKSGK